LEIADSVLKRICFQYKDDAVEWLDFGSRRIYPFGFIKSKKMERKALRESTIVKDLTIKFHDGNVPGAHDDLGISLANQRGPSEADLSTDATLRSDIVEHHNVRSGTMEENHKEFQKSMSEAMTQKHLDPTNEESFVAGGM
jgi:hypothetical protein